MGQALGEVKCYVLGRKVKSKLCLDRAFSLGPSKISAQYQSYYPLATALGGISLSSYINVSFSFGLGLFNYEDVLKSRILNDESYR